MHVVLQVSSEFGASQKIVLRHGQSLNIGQGSINDFAFPEDASMSYEHFAIELSTAGCQLRNLKKKVVTTINGQEIESLINVHNGDEIVAGQTKFKVEMDEPPKVNSSPDAASTDAASRPETAAPVLVELGDLTEPDSNSLDSTEPKTIDSDTSESAVMEQLKTKMFEPAPGQLMDDGKNSVFDYFCQLPQPLFALLDAARDPMVFALLAHSDHEFQSLYEGSKGDELANVAPYLVKLPSDSQLLRKLVELGWGKSWGVFLTSNASFEEIRKHFRKFLMVKTDEGKEVYFRFYDPRVFRVFLPTCLREESESFFGPVNSYFVEDGSSEDLLEFAVDKNGSSALIPLAFDPVT